MNRLRYRCGHSVCRAECEVITNATPVHNRIFTVCNVCHLLTLGEVISIASVSQGTWYDLPVSQLADSEEERAYNYYREHLQQTEDNNNPAWD